MGKKIIFGLVGQIASGKDTVADYLEKKYQAKRISFSGMLRDILNRLFLPINRKNLVATSEIIRKQFGQDLMAKVIAEEVKKSDAKIICLPNIRRNQDIKYLSKIPGFILVHITAEPKIRYQRLINRRENIDDKNKTWAQFIRDSKLPTEVTIKQVAKKAKYTIDNNGSLNELHEQVEKILKKHKK
ncbi:MAG: AAA family ATPase [Candidatus Buchananbacteria bacterium]|nr:AAA family ATPase [Candidatus Buchananbacteria bacterium]